MANNISTKINVLAKHITDSRHYSRFRLETQTQNCMLGSTVLKNNSGSLLFLWPMNKNLNMVDNYFPTFQILHTIESTIGKKIDATAALLVICVKKQLVSKMKNSVISFDSNAYPWRKWCKFSEIKSVIPVL